MKSSTLSLLFLLFSIFLISSCGKSQVAQDDLEKQEIVGEAQISNETTSTKTAIVVGDYVLLGSSKLPIYSGNVTIRIADAQFFPQLIYIRPNTTVTWINTIDRPHRIADYNELFRSDTITFNKTYSRTFTGAGNFDYYSETLNFKGTIIAVS